jgi:hypothetical protein
LLLGSGFWGLLASAVVSTMECEIMRFRKLGENRVLALQTGHCAPKLPSDFPTNQKNLDECQDTVHNSVSSTIA